MLADAGLCAAAVRGLQQHVDGAIEFLLGRFEMPLFELELAGLEMLVRGGDQPQNRVIGGNLRLGSLCVLTDGSDGRRRRVHGLRLQAGSAGGCEGEEREQ